jgi:hypothetical protein
MLKIFFTNVKNNQLTTTLKFINLIPQKLKRRRHQRKRTRLAKKAKRRKKSSSSSSSSSPTQGTACSRTSSSTTIPRASEKLNLVRIPNSNSLSM